MSTNVAVAEALIREAKRHLLEEFWPRLQRAVPTLGSEELWHRENEHTNSVGHLLLHLNGNVRQWIVSGLGGARDDRDRSSEFSHEASLAPGEVMNQLERTLGEAAAVLDGLDPETLLEVRRVQGESVTGVRLLVHVVEHFSYHVGQITHIVKAARNVDLGYYRDRDLNQHND